MKRQNFFAGLADFITENEGYETVTVAFGILFFAGVWIATGSFWCALIAFVPGYILCGLATLFLACLAMMFAWHEDDRPGCRLASFLIPLPGLLMSGSLLYLVWLLSR